MGREAPAPGGKGHSLTESTPESTMQDMTKVNVHEAKTHLSRLLLRVAGGEEIVIARAGRPVAKLVSIEPKAQRVIGQDDGLFEVPDDFDAPLPDEVLALFQS
jgi:prevent-host-death family protein